MKKSFVSIICLVVLLITSLCVFLSYRIIRNKDRNISHNSKIVVDDALKSDVISIIDSYLSDIFYDHSNRYCGILDYDDNYIEGNDIYYANKTFKSISEIKNKYLSIISSDYFNNNLKDKFVEHNGKLYCLSSGRSNLDYEKGSLSIEDINIVYDVVVVTGSYKTSENDMNPSESFKFKAGLLKSNDTLVINSYDETR